MNRTPARGGTDWTSIYAYRTIIDTLGIRQKHVLIMLMNYHKDNDHAPTGSELEAFSGISGCWKRLSELERKGAIHRGAARKCTVTEHMARTWILGPADDEEQGDLF